MNRRNWYPCLLTGLIFVFSNAIAEAQFPGRGGPGPGGPNAQQIELVEKFDKDQDGVLNEQERKLARKEAQRNASGRRGGPGGPGGGRRGRRGGSNQPTGKPGQKVDPNDVELFPNASLYEPGVLRTIFLEFDAGDWEKELADFKPTDVEVPAKLIVDGKTFPEVGVSFRGSSSFFHVAEGMKRSLNISMDYRDEKTRLYGYKTLNLLNCNGDASMMSSVLYSKISGHRIPTPKANLVKVVINGRSWGIYSNVQQCDKIFLEENYGSKKGTRWKVAGSPRGDGGLRYLGDDIEPYRERFKIKSAENQQAWKDLIHLCKVLNQTPIDQLEEALEPILDIDEALWFLATDVALINSDGYWVRASDYYLFQDAVGKFHVIPHDMNESFRESRGGPGGPGGPQGGRRGGFRSFFGPPPGDRQGPPPGDRQGPPGEFGLPPRQQERGDRPPRRGGPPEQDRGRPQESFEGRRGGPPEQGRGGRGGPPEQRRGESQGGGVELDPLIGLENDRMPLRSKLLNVPRLQTRYLQYMRIIAQDLLAWEHLGLEVKQFRDLIAREVELDSRKLTTTAAFKTATAMGTPAERGSLRAFANARSRYLLTHEKIKATPVLTSLAESNASAANLFPFQDNADVVINELMANNSKTAANPKGEFVDWIELRNRSSKEVDLSSLYLSDDPEQPHKWRFPKGTAIEANGYLVVWADKQVDSAQGLHANFQLSAKGEVVTLANETHLLDKVAFGSMTADTAVGRMASDKMESVKPTPGEANETQ